MNAPKGKRSFTKDHMSVATGQARLFGSENDYAAKENAAKVSGKRIVRVPPMQNQLL